MSDLEIVHNELRLKDMERIDSLIETTKKLKGRGLRKEQVVELELCERIKAWLESARDIRFGIPGDVGGSQAGWGRGVNRRRSGRLKCLLPHIDEYRMTLTFTSH